MTRYTPNQVECALAKAADTMHGSAAAVLAAEVQALRAESLAALRLLTKADALLTELRVALEGGQ